MRIKLKGSAYLLMAMTLLDWIFKTAALQLDGGIYKYWPGLIEINVLRNRGLLFGIGHELAPYVLFLMRCSFLLLLFGILWTFYRLKWWQRNRFGFLLLLFGGGSNAVEGLARGFVTDYISLFRFPVVNIADLMIVCGSGIFLFNLFRKSHASNSI